MDRIVLIVSLISYLAFCFYLWVKYSKLPAEERTEKIATAIFLIKLIVMVGGAICILFYLISQ